MPITIDGVEYLSTAEASVFIGCSYGWFCQTIVPTYKLKPRKKAIGRTQYYARRDLEKVRGWHPA